MPDKNKDSVKEFLSHLPQEMIELTLEAVRLTEKMEHETDEAVKRELARELNILNQEIILSAREDHSMAS
jgi:hypothetical protein